MHKIIAIATELTKVEAAFNEAQRKALEDRVLPLLSWLNERNKPYAYLGDQAKRDRTILVPDKPFDVLRTNFWMFYQLNTMLSAVVSTNSPAARAKAIKVATTGYGKPSELKNLADDAFEGAKACLKLKKWLSPEAIDFLKAFVASPTTKLLRQSWPYIAAEVVKESKSLIKDNDLMPIPENVNTAAERKALFKRIEKVLQSLGFKKGTPEASNSKNWPKAQTAYVKGELAFLVDSDSGVFPLRIVNGVSYSDRRTGVDDGWAYVPTYKSKTETVESWIESVVHTSEDDLASLKKALANEVFPLAPGLGLRMNDAQKEDLKKSLRTRGVWTYHPSGFGTGYQFRTAGKGTPASKALIDLVGKPVTYTTFDAD